MVLTYTPGCAASTAARTWSKPSIGGSPSGLEARTSGCANQTISWLTTASVPVKQTISTKNQIGRASQLWTRNQSFERDFFDIGQATSIRSVVSMRFRSTGCLGSGSLERVQW